MRGTRTQKRIRRLHSLAHALAHTTVVEMISRLAVCWGRREGLRAASLHAHRASDTKYDSMQRPGFRLAWATRREGAGKTGCESKCERTQLQRKSDAAHGFTCAPVVIGASRRPESSTRPPLVRSRGALSVNEVDDNGRPCEHVIIRLVLPLVAT